MKRVMIPLMIFGIAFASNMESVAQILYNGIGYIPKEYQINWTNAGLLPENRPSGLQPETPIIADHFIVLTPGGNCDEKIQFAINNAKQHPGVSIIFFSEGVYELNSSIALRAREGHRNIIFQGANANSTILEFKIGEDSTCFDIQGRTIDSTKENVSSDIQKGATILKCSNTLERGDWIWVCENDFNCEDAEKTKGIVGQITQIAGNYDINNSGYLIKDVASKEYLTANNLWVKKLQPITNIGIENLTIKRIDIAESSDEAYGRGNNIKFNYAVNCWVKGVEFYNTCRNHIEISHSSHIEVSGCYIHHALSYGSGSYGYGIILQSSTTNCLIENNIFRKLRHAIGIASGANCNVITYNFSTEQFSTIKLAGSDFIYPDSDICLHGRYPYANLFEYNFVEFIEADSTHGLNGPYNTFVRNMVYDEHQSCSFDLTGYQKIDLYYAPITALLGNQVNFDSSGRNLDAGQADNPVNSRQDYIKNENEKTSLSVEAYGFNDNEMWSHNQIDSTQAKTLALLDVSYYYSSIPDFISQFENLQFPTIGPLAPDYGDPYSTHHFIPSYLRFHAGDSIMTYLPDPLPFNHAAIDSNTYTTIHLSKLFMKNYPNPFNSITNISYRIPDENMVILRVYDILGREVITLVNNEEKKAGYYSVPWDGKDYLGKNVASGMYFYQLRFEDQIVTHKMILMR